MKFSFESKGYRDNLAKELTEKRKESRDDANQLLEEKKGTEEYSVAKDIKNVSSKIEKSEKEAGAELEVKEIERRDVGDKYEIKTFDISAAIPKSVQLYFDRIRLQKVQELKDYPLKGDYRVTGYTENIKELDGWFGDEIEGVWEDINNKTDNFLLEETNKVFENRWKYIFKIEKDAKNFINKITGGAFFDPKVFSHVIEGEMKDKRLESEKRFPHLSEDVDVPREEVFGTNQTEINQLYFNSGGSAWYHPLKIVILCYSENKKLAGITKSASVGWNTENTPLAWKDGSLSTPEVLKAAAKYTNPNHGGGILIKFKEEETWEEIADWIIDLWHGKLYRITEKTGDAVLEEEKSIIPVSPDPQGNGEPFEGLPSQNDLLLIPGANRDSDPEEYREKLIKELKRRGMELK